MYVSGYRCLACQKEQSSSFEGYVCPSCGANLDVQYDYEGLKGLISEHQLLLPGRDDIFRFGNLLPIESIDHAPPLRVGNTPLYHARRLGEGVGLDHLYLKDDGLNPSGSFKDRASAVAITRAVEQGAQVVAGASTGNAGSSMACMAASLGIPCVVFVPESAPPAKLAQLLIFGAHVLAVRGTYDDAFDLCMKTCEEQGWFNRNTGFNPFTREGKKTASYEICEQFSWLPPDRIMVCVGDGNIISGLWKGIRDLLALELIESAPKIDAVQSSQSSAISNTIANLRATNTFPTDWSTVDIHPVRSNTIADSISVDLPRDGVAGVRAVIESGGEAVTVDDPQILEAIPELAQRSGVFAEPSAAAVYAGLKKMVSEGRVQRDERVVCMVTGNGLKDTPRALEAAPPPVVIDPTVEAARKAVSTLV